MTSLNTPRSTSRPGKLIRTALITIGIGWVVAIAALFVPIDTLPPIGIVVFVGSTIAFGGCVAVGVILAVVAGAMSFLTERRRDQQAYLKSAPNHVATIALFIVILAPSTCIAEKVIAIVAAASS